MAFKEAFHKSLHAKLRQQQDMRSKVVQLSHCQKPPLFTSQTWSVLSKVTALLYWHIEIPYSHWNISLSYLYIVKEQVFIPRFSQQLQYSESAIYLGTITHCKIMQSGPGCSFYFKLCLARVSFPLTYTLLCLSDHFYVSI